MCEKCGHVDDERIMGDINQILPSHSITHHRFNPLKNPFSKIKNKRLYSAFFTNKNIERKNPKILKILDLICSSERYSSELKASVLYSYTKYMNSTLKKPKYTILALLVCLEYGLKIRKIPLPHSQFRMYIEKYQYSEQKTQSILACKNQYMLEIQEVLGWTPIVLDLNAYAVFVMNKLDSDKFLKKKNQPIMDIIISMGRLLKNTSRPTSLSNLILASCLINIASFILPPYISCKEISSMIHIDYINLSRKVHLVYDQLYQEIMPIYRKNLWQLKIIHRRKYF